MTDGDNDLAAVVGNLKNARKSWSWLTRIMVQEGTNPRLSRMFSKAVIQAVLLFGSDMWVLTPRMERALGSFQHRVARRITGRQPMQQEEGGWYYPHLETDTEEAGFEEIMVYILKSQNTLTQYIETQLNLDLCNQLVRRPGA